MQATSYVPMSYQELLERSRELGIVVEVRSMGLMMFKRDSAPLEAAGGKPTEIIVADGEYAVIEEFEDGTETVLSTRANYVGIIRREVVNEELVERLKKLIVRKRFVVLFTVVNEHKPHKDEQSMNTNELTQMMHRLCPYITSK